MYKYEQGIQAATVTSVCFRMRTQDGFSHSILFRLAKLLLTSQFQRNTSCYEYWKHSERKETWPLTNIDSRECPHVRSALTIMSEHSSEENSIIYYHIISGYWLIYILFAPSAARSLKWIIKSPKVGYRFKLGQYL